MDVSISSYVKEKRKIGCFGLYEYGCCVSSLPQEEMRLAERRANGTVIERVR